MNDEGISLLLVDDRPENLLALEAMLSGLGARLVKADSGGEALRCVLKEDFAVILLDVQMPDLDGFETARLIQGRERSRNTPIIFLTAHALSPKDVSHGYSAGAVDYLFKPFVPEILRSKVAVFLDLFRKSQEVARSEALLRALNDDLTQANRKLKETQAYLAQSEKMASLGQLVAGIAHEINNPLAFVSNNVFTVTRGLDQIALEAGPHLSPVSVETLAKVRARLKDTQEGVDRVKDLVLKLRTFSRLDEGEFKTVDVHEGLDSVLLFLRHRMKNRIEVEKRYGPDGTLSCYAGQLNQVFMNVIANAVDAIEGEGKITIATGREDGMFFVSVRDTGRGMPEEVRGRVFDPFFTTKPVGQGTGLGLAISYGIIQAHHGAIEVHSEEGRGTEFVIKVPLNLRKGAGDA